MTALFQRLADSPQPSREVDPRNTDAKISIIPTAWTAVCDMCGLKALDFASERQAITFLKFHRCLAAPTVEGYSAALI